MINTYHLDFETKSRADLRKVGAYRYAADPSTRILMFAIRKNKGPVLLWFNSALFDNGPDGVDAKDMLIEALHEARAGKALLKAHNAEFERAISKYRMQPDLNLPPPPIEAWRCTAAMARKAGLRPSLANVGEDLGLQQMKWGEGYQLIRLFSIPQKDGEFIDPRTEPEKFHRFGEYCVQDVKSESEVDERLAPFELKGATLDSYLFDARLNDRGIPLNIAALKHAQKIIDEVQARVAKEFTELTGLQPGQRDKVKKLLETVYGVKLVNMQSKTLDNAISYHDDPDDEEDWEMAEPSDNAQAVRILSLYKQLSFAAIKKVRTMLDCACPDGRARGMFLWHGAGTGRQSGQKIQPQNFKRPTISDSDGVYEMICNGATAEQIDLVYGNPLEAIANCIRNFIHDCHDDGGSPMLDADYSAIEARIVAWLSGEEWRMKVFKGHGKIYEASASEMFKIPLSDVTKSIRQKGKIAELAFGYQGAVKAAIKMGALDMGLKEEELQPLVDRWRDANPNIVRCWYALEAACKRAIIHPGEEFTTNRISFRCAKVAGLPYLLMKLPSGRSIAYPHPKWSEEDGITYYGQIPGTAKWGRVSLYGGKILENASQAITADILFVGVVNAERMNFIIWALIHDQALAKADGGAERLDEFIKALTDLPPWADGLPIKAEGEVAPFYRKSA